MFSSIRSLIVTTVSVLALGMVVTAPSPVFAAPTAETVDNAIPVASEDPGGNLARMPIPATPPCAAIAASKWGDAPLAGVDIISLSIAGLSVEDGSVMVPQDQDDDDDTLDDSDLDEGCWNRCQWHFGNKVANEGWTYEWAAYNHGKCVEMCECMEAGEPICPKPRKS